MIGLDTNVLLRAITGDDPVVTPLAEGVLSGLTDAKPGVVNGVVLAELAWPLRTRYGYARTEIAGIIERLTARSAIHVGDRDAVMAAITRSREEGLDFADALIGELNRSAGCSTTLTFDQKAARSTAFTLVA
ncbi:type II toxin-antitoxin system VapC family toxin [Nostoc sp. NIES-2111]